MTTPAATDPAILAVPCCTLFHSYARIELRLDPAAAGLDPARPATITLRAGTTTPPQTTTQAEAGPHWTIAVEALVTPADFPAGLRLELTQPGRAWRAGVASLAAHAATDPVHPLLPEFTAALDAAAAARAPARPRLLDIGGRARSGIQRSAHFPQADTTTLDIIAAPGVDIVADAHELSRHLPLESIDFALSIAVFEHLAMPWKAAVEMARVLRHGALALVITHQTIGMHDLPWDFFRFSDAAWSGIFNHHTGFEIIATRLATFMHILPRAWSPRHRGAEAAGGFEASAVLVRRIGPPLVDWPVPLADILQTRYPTG